MENAGENIPGEPEPLSHKEKKQEFFWPPSLSPGRAAPFGAL